MGRKFVPMTSGWILCTLLLYNIIKCSGCPEPCSCYYEVDKSITADCMWKNLTRFPEVKDDIAQLHMSHNDLQTLSNIYNSTGFLVLNELWADFSRIQYIEPKAFNKLNQLSKLILRYNFIEHLEEDVFYGLDNLSELRLEGNMINNLSSYVFKSLINLVDLHLDNNKIDNIESKTFEGLSKLKVLSLANNFILELELETFDGLKSLMTLMFQGNRLHNLSASLFDYLENLKFLRLDSNRINYISNITFSKLSNLLELNLNNNLLKNFRIVSINSESNIHWKKLMPKLYALYLNHNKLEELDQHTLRECPNLKFLDVSVNSFINLHRDTFIHNPVLNTLILEKNPQMKIAETMFLNSTSLEVLHLSYCKIKGITAGSFESLPNLKIINLDNNLLKTFNTDSIINLKKLTNVSLFSNPLICSCELKNTLDWSLNNNLSLSHNDPHCLFSSKTYRLSSDLHAVCELINKASNSRVLKHFIEPIIFALIFFFGSIATGALLLIFTCYERIVETPNSCIFSLALGDFLIIMIFIPLNFTSAFTHIGLSTCKVFMFIRDLIIGVTVFSVIMFSFHQFTFTIGKYKLRNSGFGSFSKTAALHLFGIWFMALSLSFPALLSATVDHNDCLYGTGYTFIRRVSVTQLFVYIVLPICFIVVIYYATARQLTLRSTFANEIIRNERKIVHRDSSILVLRLTLVFFICYTPDLLIRILLDWSVVDRNTNSFQVFLFLSECFFFSNSWLNPLVIYLTYKPYRRHFIRILYCERIRKHSLRRKPTLAYTNSSGMSLSDQQSSTLDVKY